jgi:phenylalanyl-tRNA synthetase beta chain
MRVPLSWLKEYVDVSVSPEELARLLTFAGLEVADIEYIGLPGAELPWDPDKLVVANILEVRQHPNADRLVLAEVDYGAAEPHTVVTGAPNLFPYKDQGRLGHPLKAVYAKEGVELYDGHAEGKVKVKLKGRPVRGVMSDAMLCSEKEIGLSDEHEGILILPDDAPVGTPLRDYLGDAVLDIDLTPNLARALSILGVAREVAALTGAPLHPPVFELDATGPSVEGRVTVTVETPELCPRFTAALIEGITVGPSPLWMQRRLIMCGMRPISNVVDVSNYVMLELGGPNHMFDADRVADQHLIVRLAREGERLTTLDGKERVLTPDRLLVCDPAGPSSIAGVMGGAESEVSDRTTRVLVEAAIWDTTTIRRTAQALKLQSEASRRFERGVDWELPPLVQRRVLGLLRQVAGGTVAQGIVDAYPRPWQLAVLDLAPQEVRRIVGITLSASEIADLLRPLGFGCELAESGGLAVRVYVPSFRQDVTILADLCEEVARMYGYDRIPSTLLRDEMPRPVGNPELETHEDIRDLLAGCGLNEAMTYSLTDMDSVAALEGPEAAAAERFVKLANPSAPERAYLRQSLLTTLVEALAANLRERERSALFELGRVYLPREGQTLPDEPNRLAIVMGGRRSPSSWHGDDPAPLDFFDLKGVVEVLLARLSLDTLVRYVPLSDDPRFHPGRAAAVVVKEDKTINSISLGVFGELHPAVRDRLGIGAPRALAGEFDLDALVALRRPTDFHPLSRYPAIVQDLAVVVDRGVPAARVAESIRKYGGALLESLDLFDVYEGPQIGPDKRSLAYRLAFRVQDRSLSDTDVSKVRTKIIKGLEFELKASIRS